jgi:DEAD/DEAH box helicase domain-containing protein
LIANEVNRKLAPDSEKQVFASYKGGLFGQDREQIENDIRSGACKGVISTSALEVGIDIKGVRQVAMVSLPQDAAAFRQRAGRLRASGHVIIFEEQSAIVSRGLSIKAKLEEPPRQPILYRGNAKLIAEQAVCFLDESEKLGIKNLRRVMQKTKDVLWPRGFIETIIRYLSDQELPEILQSALPPGRIPPQRYHSLRSFDGPNRSIMIFDPKAEKLRTLGDVTQSQALSEAFPGAVIYFRGKPYRVIKWSSAGGSNRPIFTRRLNADEYAQRLKTKGYIKTVLTTYLNDLRITGKRYRTNRNNDFMADTKITVSKSVSGFSELSGKKFTRVFYNNNRNKEALVKKFGKASGIEVSQTTEYKAPPGHAYDTTGLVMRISGKWFTKTAARQIAKMMHQAACEEFKISPKDLQIATRNIKIGINAKDFVEDRAIVICDKTPGSLYLSRKIFDHFPAVITRMIDQCSDSTMEHWILELHDWYKGLRISKTPTYKQFVTTHLPQKLSSSQKVAYSPGSILYWKRNNTDEPLRVRIENVEMIRGVLRYGVREVGWDYNPYRAKGERALGLKPKAKPQGYLITNYVVAANLQEPDAATFRFGIYDTIKKEFIDTAKKSSDNDNKEKGVVRGTSGNAPDAKP